MCVVWNDPPEGKARTRSLRQKTNTSGSMPMQGCSSPPCCEGRRDRGTVCKKAHEGLLQNHKEKSSRKQAKDSAFPQRKLGDAIKMPNITNNHGFLESQWGIILHMPDWQNTKPVITPKVITQDLSTCWRAATGAAHLPGRQSAIILAGEAFLPRACEPVHMHVCLRMSPYCRQKEKGEGTKHPSPFTDKRACGGTPRCNENEWTEGLRTKKDQT